MNKNRLILKYRKKIGLLLHIKDYLTHLFRYYKYSNTDIYSSETNLIAILVINYHVIEKGLTMPNFRFGFGQERVLELINNIEQYKNLNFDINNIQYRRAISVVGEYINVHKESNFKLNDKLSNAIEKFILNNKIEEEKQKDCTIDEYFSANNKNFKDFSNSRHSIRDFSDKDIPLSVIQEVADLCNNTPTPCNRQPNNLYVVADKALMAKILELQGGTRGFGHLANKLLIITSNVSVYSGVREAFEGAKSGGMYAMNLLYSLHFHGIGACTLEWGLMTKEEKFIRKSLSIPNNEEIVLMILCGYPSDKFKLANSCRTPLKIKVS